MSMKTASATSRMMETKSGRISVQRITVVIDRRRNTLAFEGVWATTAVSDMRLENSKGDRNCQFRIARIAGFKDGGADRNRTCDLLIANETLSQLSYDP